MKFKQMAALGVVLAGAGLAEARGDAGDPRAAFGATLAPDAFTTVIPLRTAEPPSATPAGPTVRRARSITADFAVLDAAVAGPRSVIRLGLFDDFAPLVSIDRVDRRHDTGYSWAGRVLTAEGGGGSFVLAVEGDAVHGAIWLEDGRAFEFRQDPAGRLWAVELNQAGFAPCETGPEHCVHAHHRAPEPQGDRGGPCPDDASRIDIMVVYTPAARIAAGGLNAITALANASISSSNNAYQASGINTRLRMVYLGEVDYTESGSFGTDLSRLRNRTDGSMDEVHGIRESVSADVVAMLNSSSGSCGVAYLMTNLSTGFRTSAFSVTRYSCAVGNLTFAHEVGHNMGSAHDRDNASSSLFDYSFGHRWSGTNGQGYRSIMAYSPGSRVARFSSPLVNFAGTPTGVPEGQANAADNARSINEAAATMANFTVLGDSLPPRIIFEPFDTVVQAGEDAQFFAIIDAAASVDLRWFRDGAPLFDGDRITGVTTSVLTIANAATEDAGAYQLYASNTCGTVFTSAASLSVQGSDCPADLADPFGTLNFFDLAAYLALFNAGDPAADLTEPFGTVNFFDLTGFLGSFNAGCP